MDLCSKTVLSICSGYGGLELGLNAALAGRTRTVCYVENEIGAASILAARMEDGSLDQAPIWSDLRSFDPEPWRGKISILAGGFPCQPHSVAGQHLGEQDPRELSGEVLRIAAGLGYPTLFLENVPGILRFYWDNIRPKLRAMGYRLAEGLFTAEQTGAPHRRSRLFILAHSDLVIRGAGQEPREFKGNATGQSSGNDSRSLEDSNGIKELADPEDSDDESQYTNQRRRIPRQLRGSSSNDGQLADSSNEGLERVKPWGSHQEGWQEPNVPLGFHGRAIPVWPPGPNDTDGWERVIRARPDLAPALTKEAQSRFRGVVDGSATGVDRRLRALGNGVVPAVAAHAWTTLNRAFGR